MSWIPRVFEGLRGFSQGYIVLCRRYRGRSKGEGGGIDKGILYRDADSKDGLRGEVVLLRIYSIVSR